MKKILFLVFFIMIQHYVFGQNDSLKSKKYYKIGIAVGTNINPLKRDMYFPYTAYDRFYLPTIHDSTNFYKNAFGFHSRFRPSLEVFYCSKNKFVQSVVFTYLYEKKNDTIGGAYTRGLSHSKFNNFSISYCFKYLLFHSKLPDQIKPYCGAKINNAWLYFNYKEGAKAYSEIASTPPNWKDTLNFKQSIYNMNLSAVVGIIGFWKHIYYEIGVDFPMLNYVYTAYTSNSIYSENFPTIMSATKTNKGKDSHILFLMRTNFFIHLGYSF